MANHLGWGAHEKKKTCTTHGTSIHVGLSGSFGFLFFLPVHIEMGLRHPFDVYPHDTRYTCPGFFSGLMICKRTWWCTMDLPSAMVHPLSRPPRWILGWTDKFWLAVPVTPVPLPSSCCGQIVLSLSHSMDGQTFLSKEKQKNYINWFFKVMVSWLDLFRDWVASNRWLSMSFWRTK